LVWLGSAVVSRAGPSGRKRMEKMLKALFGKNNHNLIIMLIIFPTTSDYMAIISIDYSLNYSYIIII
jgi:hypothetical protein